MCSLVDVLWLMSCIIYIAEALALKALFSPVLFSECLPSRSSVLLAPSVLAVLFPS